MVLTLKKQIKRHLNGASVVFTLVISVFALFMMIFGGGKITLELILFTIVVGLVLIKSGELALRTFRLTKINVWLPMAFVVGFVVISLPMVALTLIFKVSALTAFWICAVTVLGLNFLIAKETFARTSSDWADTAIALLFAISIGFLAKIPVSSPMSLLNTGVLSIWSDYFLHGVTIASLGSPFASGVDMELAGIGISFYHYAPFIIPAAFQTVSGMTGLALATSLLLPLGLLVAAFGSYAFAVELGGRIGGLFAITVVICLPVYATFIQSGWFDFYWLLFATPGLGYALGVSAVVCVSTVTYLRHSENRVLWFTIALLFSLILIRVHVFMLLAPAIVSLIVLHHWRRHIRLLLWVVISAIFVGLFALHFFTDLHAHWVAFSHPHEYLNFALQWSLFNGQAIKFFEYPLLTAVFQLWVILAAVLGGYLVLYPLSFWLSVRRFGFHALDALPLLLLISFIGLMLFAPTARNGDFTEYKHRHFNLIYVVIAIYTIIYASNLLSVYFQNKNNIVWRVYGFMVFVFATTIGLNWNSNPARPDVEAMPWASKLDNISIIPGLVNAAQYIKENAKYGDVLATGFSSSNTSDVSNLNIQAVSLTGVPAFISRADLKMTSSQCIKQVVNERLSLLNQLSTLTNWAESKSFLQNNGIRWFLVTSEELPAWDPGLKSAVFSSNSIAVYDSGFAAGKALKKPEC